MIQVKEGPAPPGIKAPHNEDMGTKMTTKTLACALAALIAAAAPALAQSKGDMTLGFGIGAVMPKDGNGTLDGGLKLDIGDSIRPTLTFEYFVMDNVGIEVLAALPFKHEINVDGLGKVGNATQLPPTITVNYHFTNDTALTPILGVGINYTAFLKDEGRGALEGADLDIGDSWGLSLHAGLDYRLSEKGSVRADLRWMDIDSTVRINGTDMGKAKIDPMVFGVSYVYHF